MQLRALLFDYGGTLDGEDHWGARFARLYGDAGVEIGAEILRAAFDHAEAALYADPATVRASLRDMTDRHVRSQLEALDYRSPALHRFLVDRFVTDSEEALERHGRLIASLEDRFKLGVVSNFYGNVERILTDAGYGRFLSVIVDSSVVGVSKPEPAIYRHAVRHLGVEAEEALHVGDSYERDILAARAAGLHTAWLTNAPQRPGDVEDLRIHALDELPPLLAKLTVRVSA